MKAAVVQSGDGSANVNRSLNAAVAGEGVPRVRGVGVPRVRGVDERAARATAEARKKAAARGLSVRNGPTNNASELDHVLNLINSAASASATASNAQKPASEGEVSNVSASNGTTEESKDADSNGPSAKSSSIAPVGLGTSLESKNHKYKKT
jgi:protein TIF31